MSSLSPGQLDRVAALLQFHFQYLALVSLYFDALILGTAAHATAFFELPGEIFEGCCRQRNAAYYRNGFTASTLGFAANAHYAVTDRGGPVFAAHAGVQATVALGAQPPGFG